MRLPDFLIIGSAKSGTTTLYEYLLRHPQIYMPVVKEPSFFGFDDIYSQGLDWYSSLFKQAETKQVCGEASTPYTHQTSYRPEIPKRIFQYIPRVKLIYIMRNPIDRAYSQYLQQVKIFQTLQLNTKSKISKVPETFEQLLERRANVVGMNDYMQNIDVLATSKYIEQINLYLQFFPRNQFLFLFFEDLCQQPEKVLTKICKFLDIDSTIDLVNQNIIFANKSSNHKEWYLRASIVSPFTSIPLLKKTYKMIPRKVRDHTYKLLENTPYATNKKKDFIPLPMKKNTREQLLQYFQKPNQDLANFLNADLSHWN